MQVGGKSASRGAPTFFPNFYRSLGKSWGLSSKALEASHNSVWRTANISAPKVPRLYQHPDDCIGPRPSATERSAPYDRDLYKVRNIIERFFAKLR